ncbi:MAG: class I SAM-dependent methyltransferase [Chloroflexota bacterium]
MDHRDHVGLIRAGVEGATDGPWADLGAGTGAFTLALADLLGAGGRIIAIDRDAGDLRENARQVRTAFPATQLTTQVADFTRSLEGLAPASLAGVVMANALHFVERRQQPGVVRSLVALLRPGGRFVLVEYDTDHGNPWVPHPMTLATWRRIAEEAGLVDVRATGRVPSRFLGAIHAAVAVRPG